MRFLANENFPGAAVTALEAAGQRILLTLDKDFGELARGARAVSSLLRTPMPRPSDVGQQLADVITARDDWAGYFSVIEPSRVRMRPLG